jgi:hypothetical protein
MEVADIVGEREILLCFPQLALKGQISVLHSKNEASVDRVCSQGLKKPRDLQSLFLRLSPPLGGVLY